MSEAVLALNAKGISTEEKNSAVIRAATMAARKQVLADIDRENREFAQRVANAAAQL